MCQTKFSDDDDDGTFESCFSFHCILISLLREVCKTCQSYTDGSVIQICDFGFWIPMSNMKKNHVQPGSTILVYFLYPESWFRIPGPSLFILAAHCCWKYVTYLLTYRIFQQTPAPMTNFLKNKEKYSIYWQYKRGLELTSWDFL